MKSVLPLIIAFVLIAMLSVATLYYVTAVVTYNANININRAYASEWRILEEEVRSVLLTILRQNSRYAMHVFKEAFVNNYRDSGFYEDPERPIIRESRNHRYTREYVYYKYSRYSSTVFYCYETHDPSDLYRLNLEGYNMSKNDYLNALNKASADATTILSKYTYDAIMRWISIREKLGYKIYLINMTSYMSTSLESNPQNGSIGISREGINVVLDIYSPWSGYNRINETVEIIFEVTFKEAVVGDSYIYLPVKALSFIVIGGEKISYILDPGNVTMILYGRIFHRMSELEYQLGALEEIHLERISGYYLGRGENILYFGLKTKRNYIAFVLNSIIYNMSLSDSNPRYDDQFRVPCSEDEEDTYIERHTMTFFIGGLIYANIDGIHIAAPIQIVYSYLFDTRPQKYDWSYSDYIVGDLGQVNWT